MTIFEKKSGDVEQNVKSEGFIDKACNMKITYLCIYEDTLIFSFVVVIHIYFPTTIIFNLTCTFDVFFYSFSFLNLHSNWIIAETLRFII